MKRQAGLSLIELMIASAIGLILLAGLSLLFVNSSETNRELQKTAQQIENGRYAIDVLSQNARLAGFYGHLHDWGAVAMPATTPPDPCETNTAELLKALWFPVQGYTAPTLGTRPDVSATTCGALTTANLQPGSDILVIRRASTHSYTSASTITNGYYIQAAAIAAEIQLRTTGDGTLGVCPTGATAAEHCKADGVTPSQLKLNNGVTPAPAAPIRRYHVHVYFVAPCSVGTGAGGVCQAGDDTIPTLKRLELSTSGSFTIVPLVEGIELLKVMYGVDTAPTDINIATGFIGDSSVDSFTAAPGDWGTVIAAKIYVLARNTEPTRGFTDDKTYLLGTTAVPARNDSFKRHVYGTTVRLMNTSGRREIPQ